jgi:ABC-type multidrug transport system fused ATPase/permease subunit
LESFGSYRETFVRNRRYEYLTRISKIRNDISDTLAELQFMPNISKYIIESSIVIGSILIAGIQFAVQDARHAVATLAVFMAAGTRVAPAILRVQQNLMQLSTGIGASEQTLQMIGKLEGKVELNSTENSLLNEYPDFIPNVELENVSVTYADRESASVDRLSLEIPSGTTVAIVGPSGAGKTTLVDLLLGIITPTTGTVRISGLTPEEAIFRWPGAIGYVPQNIYLANTTIRENVSLGYPAEYFSDRQIMEAIEVAQLTSFVNSLNDGLDTQIADFGANLSGGQRQRLGIARAMITRPKLLVLDEATSALDGQTESEVSSAIAALKGKATVVLVAHRLSTIRNADQIVYLNKGQLVCKGTLDFVKSQVSEFAKQSHIEGI